jgi:hypothetical protein
MLNRASLGRPSGERFYCCVFDGTVSLCRFRDPPRRNSVPHLLTAPDNGFVTARAGMRRCSAAGAEHWSDSVSAVAPTCWCIAARIDHLGRLQIEAAALGHAKTTVMVCGAAEFEDAPA